MKNKFFDMSPWKFCLGVFFLSRSLLFLQLNWLNQIFALHLHAQDWLRQFDSGFYINIVQDGYDRILTGPGVGMPNDAFFPLMPLIVAAVHHITLMPIEVAGIFVANACFLVSLFLFYRLITQYFKDELSARFAVVLLAFTPFNIYFASFYTESLFLLLSLMIWLAALEKKWLWVGVMGALLSATRPTGVLILLPMLYFAWQDWRVTQNGLKKYWAVLLIPIGLFSFMIYLHIHTGNAFAFRVAEYAWHRDGWHWHGFFHQLLHNMANRYNAFFLLVSLYLMYKLYRWQHYAEALWFFLVLLPAVASGVFDSIARYAGTLFVFYMAIVYFCHQRRDWMLGVLCIEFAYLGIYLAGWINGRLMFI